MKRILSLVRSAVQDYAMIQENDRIAVAVSGGKDSMVMLDALNRFKNFYPVVFSIGVICIDIGFDNTDFSPIQNYCNEIGIECHIEKTVIKKVVFDEMKEKNPCSLCSRMRRAALCSCAEKLGYNKIALGHHRDDANETFLMNIIYNGKAECFEPVTSYEDKKITIIRPMVRVSEGKIFSYAKKSGIPTLEKVCPADGKTDRENIKKLIKNLNLKNKNISKNIFSAVEKHESFSLKKCEVNKNELYE